MPVKSKKTIYYCGIPIEYTLTKKQVKNVNIRINEEGEIFVSGKKGVSDEEINKFVESKAEWIIRNLAEVERYNQMKPDNEMYTGKKVYYLGFPYIINVCESDENQVEKEENGIISISTKNLEDSEYNKELYLKWLKKEALKIYDEVLRRMYKVVEGENIPFPKVTVRNMKSRWGSCSPSNNSISLNIQLMKTDIGCIEQVVLHELLHFKELNHSENFYNLLDKYMSDWKARKDRLEEKYKDGI
jgi:Predicted metal-dependent hydrolase